MNRLITALTATTLIAGLIGGFLAWEKTIAKAGEMQVIRTEIKLLHARFTADQKIRRCQAVQERLWTLSDRYEGKPMPQSVREEKRRLEIELETLKDK